MASATKRKLSSSTNGRGIKIDTVATPGTLLHTAVAGITPGTFDEIWLFAYNGDIANRLVTFEFGGASVPDDNIGATVAYQSGLMLIVPGLILQNGCEVRAFAGASGTVSVFGFVNSVTD